MAQKRPVAALSGTVLYGSEKGLTHPEGWRLPRVTRTPVLPHLALMIKETRLPTILERDATDGSVWKWVYVPSRCGNDLRESEGRSERDRRESLSIANPLWESPMLAPPEREAHGWSLPSSDQRVRNPPREGLASPRALPFLD